ncbi:XRE family transcriptional regulator [Streptomyces sp. AJS327]|uniref:helix-turn-helix domain-containing protein n=1 Tax=Streptomyces sp. AJS327 TaxID=2545265 RepID=UPI0015DDA0A5|nr:helix-turn-helix transcriptional regulator [Streptomyces sp. AJS327]MBA0053197.1 XRE family transcriptional regulator [Streptomyces sp. AJS327]
MTVEEDKAPDPSSSLLAFFGSELRRIRIKCGLSQEETARKAHTTQSMLSKVEFAKRVPSAELARDLDVALNTDGYFLRLHPLVLRHSYPKWFVSFVELEQTAAQIRTVQTMVLPGLLQTEEYARAVLDTMRPDHLDDLVTARASRQDVFDRKDRPRCWFIIDEYVLLRHLGGPEVMRQQFGRMLELGREPRNVIQVIPRETAAHPGVNGAFTLLGFDEGSDVLHVDGFSQGRTTANTEEVNEATRIYDLLRATALSPEASAEVIGAHMEGLNE